MVRLLGQFMMVSALVVGCASAPKTHSQRTQLERDAAQAQREMLAKDPTLQSLLDRAAGHIVFPEIKQGGFVVGGASGRGVIYEHGRPSGFADLSQASVGAQVGGQKFAEMIDRPRQIHARQNQGQLLRCRGPSVCSDSEGGRSRRDALWRYRRGNCGQSAGRSHGERVGHWAANQGDPVIPTGNAQFSDRSSFGFSTRTSVRPTNLAVKLAREAHGGGRLDGLRPSRGDGKVPPERLRQFQGERLNVRRKERDSSSILLARNPFRSRLFQTSKFVPHSHRRS